MINTRNTSTTPHKKTYEHHTCHWPKKNEHNKCINNTKKNEHHDCDQLGIEKSTQ